MRHTPQTLMTGKRFLRQLHRCFVARSSTAVVGRAWCCAAIGALLALLPASQRAAAQVSAVQGSRSVPPATYYAAQLELYEGDYRDALRDFQSELRGAIKTPQSSWIDSICFHAMLGETYYHMGDYASALTSYNAALKLYSNFSDWMIRVRFPGNIPIDTSRLRQQIPWGRSTRAFKLGKFPDTVQIAQGKLNNNDVLLGQGGVVQKAVLFPIKAEEIVRCTALALRRRRELMGPVCKVDPLTAEVLAKLTRRPGPQNWSEAWIDLQLGLAHACAGETVQAEKLLQRALLAGGEYDHPLSCVAMVELGKLAMEAGDFNAAAALFEEASYSAFYYENPGVLEESFRLGQRTHLLANKRNLYPPLALAGRWARSKRLRHFQVWIALLAAENQAALGDTNGALKSLGEARGLMGNRALSNGMPAVKHAYLTAQVNYMRGQPAPAGEAFSNWVNAQRKGASLWTFQIKLVDHFYTNGTITPRGATELYQKMLRDPLASDWRTDPENTLSVLVVPHPISFEYWFDAALKRKEIDTALTIADMARRHRFYSTLPMGGRLLALRAILESPPDRFGKEVALQQQDIFVRYPVYAKLSQQAGQIKAEISRGKLAPPDDGLLREQQAKLQQLARISLEREAALHQMALQREPSNLVPLPLHPAKDIQDTLGSGQAALVFFDTTREMHAFLVAGGEYAHWRIASRSTLQKGIAKLLREMGNFDGNRELTQEDLLDPQWHATARKVLEYLLRDSHVDLTQRIDELVIVPDGITWYLPFEALPPGAGEDALPLLATHRVRYAPLLSLSIPDEEEPRKQAANMAVSVGKLFPRDQETVGQIAFEQLQRAVPAAEPLPSPLPATSSVLRTVIDRLVVLDDIDVDAANVYGWTPIGQDRGKAASTLGQWLALPWGNPDQIILPGFHTAAEHALKRTAAEVPPGQEVFLSVCGMMAGGTRTILLSRWRIGGQTTYDLVREFVQELPYVTASEAWQRSVELAKERPLNPELEPRLRYLEQGVELHARHPFFWSGYMLIDTGVKPRPEQQAAGGLDAAP